MISINIDGRLWRNDTKNSTINKKANNGNGNYSGFSKSKVQSWSRDEAYINAIKNLNNGKFPATKDYKYPTTTSGDTLDFWDGRTRFLFYFRRPLDIKISH